MKKKNQAGAICSYWNRNIHLCFVNNYNAEWIVAWDANIDLSVVNDFFGAITYITDYWAKDSTGLTNVLKVAMKNLKNQEDMRQRCYELADVFMSHRQVGEAEVFYKLLPHMHLVVSSIATIYVPTEPKSERRQFLQRQDPEEGKGFKVNGKEGLFLEKQDLISKYERRRLCGSEEDIEGDDTLEELCLSHFVKMYEGRGYKPKPKVNEEGEREEAFELEDGPEVGELADEDLFNYVIVGDEAVTELKELPRVITLSNLVTGEPPLLHRRSFPRSLRYFKKHLDKDPHRYYLSELYLYHPFRDESDLHPDDPEACEKLYRDNEMKIKRVKAQVMPYLESVEEAKLMYEQSKDDDEDELDDIGAELDPENEQEIGDAEDEGVLEHPEYAHLDPDQVEDHPDGGDGGMRVFKTITIPDPDVLLEQARKLDCRQKEVLRMGIRYCRQSVKYRINHHEKPTPPLVMVHGGAGAGKSTVIHLLSVMMQKILHQPGDDPSYPYVLMASFTGAAAANINGQTLHSLFGFKFGHKFISLDDKKRDEKRLTFQNLKIIIIDEISMVSADLLYNLDLKLREITLRDEMFGGISIFAFGDLFQLQPVNGHHVFQEPCNEEHRVAFILRNLWQCFKVVNLEENHRQGEAKEFGDLLNRVRVGNQTEEDLELLRTRVRPEKELGHPQQFEGPGEANNYFKDDGRNKVLNNNSKMDQIPIENPTVRVSTALHIYGKNKPVTARNLAVLNNMPGELFTSNALNMHRTIKNWKPQTDAAGCVKNTPFQSVLKLKKGAEVILTLNVNTVDGLTNGARGVLLSVEKKNGAVAKLIVKFHNPEHGREQRERMPCRRFKDGTYIEPVLWQYIEKGLTAKVFQFPVRLAASITSHKIQVRLYFMNVLISQSMTAGTILLLQIIS